MAMISLIDFETTSSASQATQYGMVAGAKRLVVTACRSLQWTLSAAEHALTRCLASSESLASSHDDRGTHQRHPLVATDRRRAPIAELHPLVVAFGCGCIVCHCEHHTLRGALMVVLT